MKNKKLIYLFISNRQYLFSTLFINQVFLHDKTKKYFLKKIVFKLHFIKIKLEKYSGIQIFSTRRKIWQQQAV